MKNELNLNDILFDVKKVEQKKFDCASDYTHDIFAYPKGKKIRVNSCSDRYELVPNAQIFPVIREILLSNNVVFTERYNMIGFSRFYVEYALYGIKDKNIEDKLNSFAFKMGEGDEIVPMLRVQHSYNGLTKYSINFGFFRLVCSNGLVIPVEEKSEFNLSISGKHTSSIKKSLMKLEDSLLMFLETEQKSVKNFMLLTDRWVENPTDRLTEVLAQTNIIAVSNKKFNTIENIISRVNDEMLKLNVDRVSEWLLYNGINQYIFDDNLNKTVPEKRMDIDRKVLGVLLDF